MSGTVEIQNGSEVVVVALPNTETDVVAAGPQGPPGPPGVVGAGLDDHEAASDPHGDRAYTDAVVAGISSPDLTALEGATASTEMLGVKATGDSNDRWQVTADGSLVWDDGSGSGGPTLGRSNIYGLRLHSTDPTRFMSIEVGGGAVKFKRSGSVSGGDTFRFLREGLEVFRIDGNTGGSSYGVLAQSGGAPAVAMVAQGAASQTAALQEWRNSAGTVLGSVSAAGLVEGVGIRSTGYAQFYGGGTGQDIVQVIGKDGQTGALQLWKDHTGQVLFKVGPTGNLVFVADGSGPVTAGDETEWVTYNGGQNITGNFARINFGNAPLFGAAAYIDRRTNEILGIGPKVSVNGWYHDDKPMLGLQPSNATTIGQVIQAQASQIADLMQFRDSAHGTLTRVNADGTISLLDSGLVRTVIGPNFLRFDQTGDGDYAEITSNESGLQFAQRNGINRAAPGSYGLGIDTISDSKGGVVVKRFSATQTAALYEASDENGTPIWGVGPDGAIFANASTDVALTVRGAASQTANLQEWRNSADQLLLAVHNQTADHTGTLEFRKSGNSSGPSLRALTDSTLSVNGSLDVSTHVAAQRHAFFNKFGATGRQSSFGHTGNTGTNIGAQVGVYATEATEMGLLIQGAASQTANLQEWRDSAGTVLSRILPDGKFRGYADLMSFGALDLPLRVQAISGQTGPLTQWQNGSGSVVTQIRHDGSIDLRSGGNRYLWAGGTPVFWFDSDNNRVVWAHSMTAASASGHVAQFRGLAGQTGDLSQWMNSSGSVRARVDSDGAASFQNLIVGTDMAHKGQGRVYIVPVAVNSKAMTLAGLNSYTSPILEFKGDADATGPVMRYIDGATEHWKLNSDGSTFMADVAAEPDTPTGGGVMYVESGALKFKGSSGTVTTIAAA